MSLGIGRGEGANRCRLGTAYAVVKIAMPVRMAVSIAAAPWFARWAVEPVRDAGRRMWRNVRGV